MRELQLAGAQFAVKPIGWIQTPFHQSKGTPIQGAVSNDATGVVELLPGVLPGLRDLEGFERLWLIYLDGSCLRFPDPGETVS